MGVYLYEKLWRDSRLKLTHLKETVYSPSVITANFQLEKNDISDIFKHVVKNLQAWYCC